MSTINYNYNYENRAVSSTSSALTFEYAEITTCTSAQLTSSLLENGKFYYATDVSKLYYAYGNSYHLINGGDSTEILNQIEEIQNQINSMDVSTVTSLVESVSTAVSEMNAAKADYDTHISNADIHVTASDKSKWNAKQDAFSNATVLSGITAAQVSAWDSVAAGSYDVSGAAASALLSANSYTDESFAALLTAIDAKQDVLSNADVLSTISQANIDDWNNDATGVSQGYVDTAISDAIAGISVGVSEEYVNNTVSTATSDMATQTWVAASIATVSLPTTSISQDWDDNNGNLPTISGTDGDKYVTANDVIAFIQDAILKKKSDEVDDGSESGDVKEYLYTNGYKIGDSAIELSSSNSYEIVLDDNDQFVIELLHKNEEDGNYDEYDSANSYNGTYFYVMIPNTYEMSEYLWDPSIPGYKSNAVSTTDPAYELKPYMVTPAGTVYYYADAVDQLLIGGSKSAIEDTISQTYNNHLLKIVVTKK